MSNIKVLITGANGQVGSELRVAAMERAMDFVFVTRDQIDLASPDSIVNFFSDKSFSFVLNCAAYTAVDKAESERELAFRINADAPGLLSEICRKKNARLIHLSTDYVFDGSGNFPLDEESQTVPVSVYGQSKLAGEQHVLSNATDAYVIRTSWVYSSFGKNFVKTIKRFAAEKPFVRVVNDQAGSPTYARDLARALLTLVESIHSGKADQPGIYHYANEGITSWYDIACAITRFYGYSCEVRAIPTSEYPTEAVRPIYTVLNKSKIKSVFGLAVPNWFDSLTRCLEEMRS